MKYYLSLVVILVVSGSIAFGQSTSAWREFTRDVEEFTVEFPEALKFEDSGKPRSSTYWSQSEQVRIFIASEPKYSRPDYEKVMDVLSGFGVTDIEIASVPAKRYKRSDDRFQYGAVTLSTQARSYVFLIVAPKGDEESVERFLASIKLTPKPDIAPEEPESIPSVPEASKKFPVADKSPFGSARSGSMIPRPTDPMSRPQSDNAGVRILSKPRPAYTDIARLLHIEGNVTLRVTFGADGTVGPVTIVSPLPFGLTELAVGAARSIGFEAARREGKPYSVVKNIEYSFSLY